MKRIPYIAYFTVATLATCGLALAQDAPIAAPNNDQSQPALQQPGNTQTPGWRRVDPGTAADAQVAGDPQADPNAPAQAPPPPNGRPGYYSGQPAPPPNYNAAQGAQPNYQQQGPPPGYQGPPPNYQGPPPGYQGPPPNYQGPRPNYQQGPPQAQTPPPPIPASLTIKSGTYITVRVNQVLSSDHNHAGDAFAATLLKPVVIDGVVVAERGQTIGGRVAEAKKAGMVEGTSRLGVQLTDLTLADGQNVPVTTQLISHNGPTSVGRDVGAVAGTTALGAAAGASADLGRGAAIGAGAGAFVGIVGVLLTRGRPTIIYPEQALTFRLEAPVTVATDHAPQAFRYVEPSDYQQADLQRRGPPTMRVAGPAPYYGAPYGPAYYGPGYYPYAYGPGIGFYYGPGYYYRGWRR
jgi:hypothetical protein